MVNYLIAKRTNQKDTFMMLGDKSWILENTRPRIAIKEWLNENINKYEIISIYENTHKVEAKEIVVWLKQK